MTFLGLGIQLLKSHVFQDSGNPGSLKKIQNKTGVEEVN